MISTTREAWADVVGWEGIYQVSTRGRVRSVDRLARSGAGTRVYRGQMRRIQLNRHGYPVVLLVSSGRTKLCTVHRLVARAFIPGHGPGLLVRHIDGSRTNNVVENLAWGTVQDNSIDAIKHGTLNRGERHHMTPLCEHCVSMIREMIATGHSQHSLSRLFGIRQSAIFNIVRGRTWKHVLRHPNHPDCADLFELREQKGSDDA